jgi:hypothetical protein
VAAGAVIMIAALALGQPVATASRVARRDSGVSAHTAASRAARRHHVRRSPGQGGRALGATPSRAVPFAPNPHERSPRAAEVPSLYADGYFCSAACRPYGAELGWPLAPFHHQHPLRAGLNELRPASLHVGVDIQARDGEAVYAVQPGLARVLAVSGPDARVQVGNYVYWHIVPTVSPGQWVTPFATVLGHVINGYGHVAFSELDYRGNYVNPLRPGGSVLRPYRNGARPVIGHTAVAADGHVTVAAYSPQSFVRRTTYVTPILAPAGMAYRLYDAAGAAVTPLEWALRGTHLLPWADRSLIYAPGARAPGYACFATRSVCVPHWIYRVAGGLAPPLPSGLAVGPYRLTIYAWDWADNTTALDTVVTYTSRGWSSE